MLDNTRKRHSQGHAVSPNDTNIVLGILIMPEHILCWFFHHTLF